MLNIHIQEHIGKTIFFIFLPFANQTKEKYIIFYIFSFPSYIQRQYRLTVRRISYMQWVIEVVDAVCIFPPRCWIMLNWNVFFRSSNLEVYISMWTFQMNLLGFFFFFQQWEIENSNFIFFLYKDRVMICNSTTWLLSNFFKF